MTDALSYSVHIEPPAAPSDPVERARYATTLDITYKLGRGGTDPEAATPADGKDRCDCSGFTAWCHGIDREQEVDGRPFWLSTAGIIADATGGRRWYAPAVRPMPGDLVVYGRDIKRLRFYGHVGIVTAVGTPDWKPDDMRCWKHLRVTHCAGSHKAPRAVRETNGVLWGKLWGKPNGTLIVRHVPF